MYDDVCGPNSDSLPSILSWTPSLPLLSLADLSVARKKGKKKKKGLLGCFAKKPTVHRWTYIVM